MAEMYEDFFGLNDLPFRLTPVPGLLAFVFGCYALAVCSRENGLMLGPVLVVFDLVRAGHHRGQGARVQLPDRRRPHHGDDVLHAIHRNNSLDA